MASSKSLRFAVGNLLGIGYGQGKAGLAPTGPWMQFELKAGKAVLPHEIWLWSPDAGVESRSPQWTYRAKRVSDDMKCYVTLQRQPVEGYESSVHGWASYFTSTDDEEGIEVQLNMPQLDYESVQTGMASGWKLSSLTLWTEGVDHGIAPDATDKIWNVTKQSTVALDGFSLAYAVEKSPEEVDVDIRTKPDPKFLALAAVAEQVIHLNERAEAIKKLSFTARRRLDYLLAVAVVGIIALIISGK